MSKKNTLFLVTLSTFFWGANFDVGKYVVEYMHPLIAAVLRFVIAALVLTVLVLYKETHIAQTIKTNWKIFIVLGLLGGAGFNGLFFYGIKYTSPVNGALIMATNPIVTVILASYLLREPILLNHRIGMFFSLLGVVLVITHGSLDMLLHLNIALGDLIIMGANICWGFYGVLNRRYLNNSKPLVTTAATMVIGTVFLILFALMGNHSMHELTNISTTLLIAVLFMSLFGTVLAFLFWNYGIANLGVVQTSIFFNLVPVFTVLVSVGLGQPVSLLQIIGGLIVIFGVLISAKVIKMPQLRTKV
jgi:drug/metabolite transporter (DMT)-like permease